MIITRTPYRVSFLGGGSDLPEFYKQSVGKVLSTSIAQYMYISIHPSFDPREIKIKYEQSECVTSLDDIQHPIVKAILKRYQLTGVEITSVGDMPAQTGLGSSSSFTVGLLKAVHTYLGNSRTNAEIANEACDIEINVLDRPIGKQDQYAAALGGLNLLTFNQDDSVSSAPVNLTPAQKSSLEDNLIMFYTKGTRSSMDILQEQVHNIATNSQKLSLQKDMVALVPELVKEIEQGNVAVIGEYLDKGWQIKQKLASSISDEALSEIYEKAKAAGSQGGKLLGAGGGGFFLFYSETEKQKALEEALGLRAFKVVLDTEGTKVVYNSMER